MCCINVSSSTARPICHCIDDACVIAVRKTKTPGMCRAFLFQPLRVETLTGQGSSRSVPAQRTAGLVLRDARLEEVLLLLEIDHLAHPREGIFLALEQLIDADLLRATVGDEAQVALEHRRVQTQHAARHGVFGVAILELDGLEEELLD